MNLQQYQESAKRTCPVNLTGLADYKSDYYKPLVDKLNFSHMVMGMTSELSELQDAIEKKDKVNVGEELTDIMWYFANYCTFRNFRLDECFRVKDESYLKNKNLIWMISEITDYSKKYQAYNKEIDRDRELNLLVGLAYMLDREYYKHDLSIANCMQNNIDKLNVRYPEKFTEENAINRNLENERKELEK